MSGRRSNSNLSRGVKSPYVITGPWTPAKLFLSSVSGNNNTTGYRGAWFDGSDLDTLYSNSSLTTKIAGTTGNSILGWKDKSGRASPANLIQYPTATGPTYTTANGGGVVLTQATQNVLASASGTANGLAVNTAWAVYVYKITDSRTNATPRIFSMAGAAGANEAAAALDGGLIWYSGSANGGINAPRVIGFRTSNTTYDPSNQGIVLNTLGCGEWSCNGASSLRTYWNGTQGSNGQNANATPMAATSGGRIAIGTVLTGGVNGTATLSAAAYPGLEIYQIIHLGYFPSPTDVSNLRHWVNDNYGVGFSSYTM